MFGHYITDKEGYEINRAEFEKSLDELFPGYIVGDSQPIGSTTMVVYGIKDKGSMVGRIDVSYRQTSTQVVVSGNAEESIDALLVSNTNFEWKSG